MQTSWGKALDRESHRESNWEPSGFEVHVLSTMWRKIRTRKHKIFLLQPNKNTGASLDSDRG